MEATDPEGTGSLPPRPRKGVRLQLPSFKWATDSGVAASVKEKKPLLESFIKEAEAKGEAELSAAGTTLRTAIEKGDRAEIGGAAKKAGDVTKKTKDSGLKKMGSEIGKISGNAGALIISQIFSGRGTTVKTDNQPRRPQSPIMTRGPA